MLSTHTQHKITREIDRGRRKPTARENRSAHKTRRKNKRTSKNNDNHVQQSAYLSDSDNNCIQGGQSSVDAQIHLLTQCLNTSSDTTTNTAPCIDSGANQSLHPDKRALRNKHPSIITGIKGVSGKRTKVDTQGDWIDIDTLHMSNTERAIISVGQYLDACNGKMTFTSKAVLVYLLLSNNRKRIKIDIRDPDGLYTTCVPDNILGRQPYDC